MKKLIALLVITLFMWGCQEKEVDMSQKQIRNGVVYLVNEDKPYSGIIVKKYENGQIEIKERYKDGLPEGEQYFYHSNGQVSMKGTFKKGKVVGEATSYYEDGQIENKLMYKDGLLDGEAISYHPNGKVKYSGAFAKGEKEGDFKYYDKDGKPIVTATYENGKLVNIQQHVLDVEELKSKAKEFLK